MKRIVIFTRPEKNSERQAIKRCGNKWRVVRELRDEVLIEAVSNPNNEFRWVKPDQIAECGSAQTEIEYPKPEWVWADDMNIIKEYVPVRENESIVVLRTKAYAKTLAWILMLYREALKTYPALKLDEVRIVYYTKGFYARTYGIEFNVKGKPGDDYEMRSEVEKT